MIEYIMAHAALVTIGAYAVVMAFIALFIAVEGERYKERWSGASAQPSLCRTLGRGLRKLGRALGRLRP